MPRAHACGMTTIIRAGAAHDLLALVPALAGFRPTRSIVCIAFRGTRSIGVLRHDLPRRARDRPAIVTSIVGTLCRMPGVDGVVPIVYTDRTFAAERGLPERALLSLVVRRAEQAGFLVRDALCRATDAWGSFLDPETPSSGHPLAHIEQSEAAALAPEGGAHAPVVTGELPEPDPSAAAAIADELAALADPARLEACLERLGAETDPVELVEALVGEAAGAHPPHPAHRLAWFAHLAGSPPMRDAMMLQVAFGADVGRLALDDAEHTVARAERNGETVDDLVEREFERGTEGEVSRALGSLLLGQATTRPEVSRVERALGLLGQLVADAPADRRVGLLCIAAWLAWSLGRGSAAGALIDRAVDAEPTHSMANLLSAFIGSGALPDWAFVAAEEGSDDEGGDRPAEDAGPAGAVSDR